MARTYKAEGRRIAMLLRGLSVLGSLVIWRTFPQIELGGLLIMLFTLVLISEVTGLWWTQSQRAKAKGRRRRTSNSTPTAARSTKKRSQDTKGRSFVRSSNRCRSDQEILTSPLDALTGVEFERLLALYFRSQGYKVQEVGVGGSDGGVDLVITDQRGEKTAVQAKCYAAHRMVSVMTVRELVGAKRNHDCILSLLVTTSDLTEPAKREADQFRVDYWHGGIVEDKLLKWGGWQPGRKVRNTSRSASGSR